MLSNASRFKRPYFTKCIALATAFAHKNQCFNIFPMRLGHIRPFKVMAMTPLRLAKVCLQNSYFYCLQRCIGQCGLKNASGHRPCPICLYFSQKRSKIIKFSILLPNTLISVTTLSF